MRKYSLFKQKVGLLIWQSIDSQKNRVTVPMDGLYVHYIDVGQGDSELVCCNGEYMLIDGGEPSASDELLNYLDKLGIEKLDYLVCTHAHADHCGGLDAVVEALEVETVFTSPSMLRGSTSRSQSWRRPLCSARQASASLARSWTTIIRTMTALLCAFNTATPTFSSRAI